MGKVRSDFGGHDLSTWRNAGKEVIDMEKEMYGAGGAGGFGVQPVAFL